MQCVRETSRTVKIRCVCTGSTWISSSSPGTEGYVEWHHDGIKEKLVDEPYFSYDSPKTFV